MTMLFLNIARMDSYRGRTRVDVPEGGGSDPNKMEVHNFHPHRGHVYGYVAAVAHSINIENLGATDSDQESVGGVDVIWTAPSINGGRDVVGWYRDARVFRYLHKYKRGLYHVKASSSAYVLLPPNKRKLNIKSARVQPGGFGHSNVWYAESDYGRRIRRRVTRLFRNTRRQVFDRDELEDQADALEPLGHAPEGVENPLASSGRSLSWAATLRSSAGFSNAPTVAASCAESVHHSRRRTAGPSWRSTMFVGSQTAVAMFPETRLRSVRTVIAKRITAPEKTQSETS